MADPVAATFDTRGLSALVIVCGGRVRWRSVGGPELPAEPELLELLAGVPVGAGRQEIAQRETSQSKSRLRVSGHGLRGADAGDRAVLYEIVSADGPDHGWRLTRLEALAQLGSWEWDVQDNRVVWSDSLLEMHGLPKDAHLDYLTYRSLLHPDDIEMIENTLAEALRTSAPFSYTHRMFRADSTDERIFECYGEVITEAGRPVRVLGTARDITEQHLARTELAFLAAHDPLTGLANRRRITERLTECASTRSGGALLLLDIDHFKDVNDLRGHAAGDEVMRTLAQRLAAAIPPDALLGRLGGDEYAVVLPGCGVDQALGMAERLCDVIAGDPIVAGRSALTVTASIGVASIAPGGDADVVLVHADLALYRAKETGRNRAQLFADEHYDSVVRRVSVLKRVREALDTGGIRLQVQPIVRLGTGVVVAHEVLARLHDEHGPPLHPGEFLPSAERTDLVLRLDRWVISHSVSALSTPAARRAGVRLQVNLSGRSLTDPDLGAWILATLDTAQVEPHRLGLEITETAAIICMDAARQLGQAVVKAGCGFALDDFGAGFGSFSQLKNLPFTSVKIAGEFVRQVDTDRVDHAILDSVVRVAHQMGMSTVAEHVDRPALVDALWALGVDQAQGFHFGRPRPIEDLIPAHDPPERR